MRKAPHDNMDNFPSSSHTIFPSVSFLFPSPIIPPFTGEKQGEGSLMPNSCSKSLFLHCPSTVPFFQLISYYNGRKVKGKYRKEQHEGCGIDHRNSSLYIG